MKNDDLNSDVLARYMTGEGSDRDREEISSWLRSDPSHQQVLEEFRHIWESASENGGTQLKKIDDVEQAWGELKVRMNPPKTKPPKRYPSLNNHSSKHPFLSSFWKVAAAVLIAGLIGFFAYSISTKNSSGKAVSMMQVFATKKGQQLQLTLSDGTHILLNADSKLKISQNFGLKKRAVYLTGEAYFKVVKNPKKPFVVHSRGTVTQDLGTSFIVWAYPDDKNVLVVVKEGRVRFKADSKHSMQANILTADQLGSYNRRKHKMSRKKVDDLNLYLGWTKGYLNFKDASMGEVAQRLERQYDVKVVFKNTAIKKMKLTASLKNRTLQHVLNLIAKALDIQYRMNHNEVIFSHG
jgi:ferric-dicitrate binding protein FerR (iron transport regulator)